MKNINRKNNKGGRMGGVCLAHNQTIAYITIKIYQNFRKLLMDFFLCILIMRLFIFISLWHDQASIFKHYQDVLCELWQFYYVFLQFEFWSTSWSLLPYSINILIKKLWKLWEENYTFLKGNQHFIDPTVIS